MIIALSAKNKLGFVDGSIPKPDGTDVNLLPYWSRNNNIVISWISNSVCKEISASIIFSDFATEIWNDLKLDSNKAIGLECFNYVAISLISNRIRTLSVSILQN